MDFDRLLEAEDEAAGMGNLIARAEAPIRQRRSERAESGAGAGDGDADGAGNYFDNLVFHDDDERPSRRRGRRRRVDDDEDVEFVRPDSIRAGPLAQFEVARSEEEEDSGEDEPLDGERPAAVLAPLPEAVLERGSEDDDFDDAPRAVPHSRESEGEPDWFREAGHNEEPVRVVLDREWYESDEEGDDGGRGESPPAAAAAPVMARGFMPETCFGCRFMHADHDKINSHEAAALTNLISENVVHMPLDRLAQLVSEHYEEMRGEYNLPEWPLEAIMYHLQHELRESRVTLSRFIYDIQWPIVQQTSTMVVQKRGGVAEINVNNSKEHARQAQILMAAMRIDPSKCFGYNQGMRPNTSTTSAAIRHPELKVVEHGHERQEQPVVNAGKKKRKRDLPDQPVPYY